MPRRPVASSRTVHQRRLQLITAARARPRGIRFVVDLTIEDSPACIMQESEEDPLGADHTYLSTVLNEVDANDLSVSG